MMLGTGDLSILIVSSLLKTHNVIRSLSNYSACSQREFISVTSSFYNFLKFQREKEKEHVTLVSAVICVTRLWHKS